MSYIAKGAKFLGDFDIVPHPLLDEGGAGSLRVSGAVHVYNTDDVSGDQTGSSQIAGGQSVSGGQFVKKDLTVQGTAGVGTTLGVDSSGNIPLIVQNRNANGSSGISVLDAGDTEQMKFSYSNAAESSLIATTNSPLVFSVNGHVDQLRFETDGSLSVSSTTASMSKTTGSLRVGGGIGVAGSVYQNYASASTGFASDSGTSAQGSVHYRLMSGGVNRWSTTLVGIENGGDLDGGDLSIIAYGTTGVLAGTLMRMTRGGVTSFPSSIAGTSKTSAAVVVTGGVGISGATYASTINATDVVFTSAQVNGNLNVKYALLSSSNTNDLSISTNNDSIYLRNNTASTSGQILSSLTNFVFFNTAATPAAAVSIEKSTSNVTVHSSTISTSTSSGSLVVGGGLGCNGTINSVALASPSITSTTITNSGAMETSTFAVNGTTAATSVSDGALTVAGGIAVAKKSYIQALVVPGVSTLNNVTIDTTNAPLEISGAQGIDSNTTGDVSFISASGDIHVTASVGELTLASNASTITMASGIVNETLGEFDVTSGASSAVTVTGNYTITPTGRFIVSAGSSAANAISLATSNVAGGVSISAGTSGMSLASMGKIDVTSTGVASQLIHTQTGSGQDLSLALAGTGSSIFSVSSTGSGVTALDLHSSVGGVRVRGTTSLSLSATAGVVSLSSPSATGPMSITQTATAASQGLAISLQGAFANVLSLTSTGTGATALTLASSAGGIAQSAVTSWTSVVTAGPFNLTSTSTSLIQQTSGADGQDLTISLAGASAGTSRLVLSSTGVGDDAIRFVSSVGGCNISAVSKISGAVSSGSVSFTGRGATGAAFTHKATGTGQDMHVGILQDGVNAATASRLVLDGFGTGNDAILLNASAGGITGQSAGPIHLDTTSISGVLIGTLNAGVPVTMGNATSAVIINNSLMVSGNLEVGGMVTIFDTQVMTVTDSTLVLHSGPSGTSDAGVLTERYQVVDLATGDIVTDVYNATGFCQTGSAPSTIVLDGTSSLVADFYKDWWVKIVQGTGSGQIRKIKSYTPGTQTAVIYANGETNGLNWATVPDSTSKYELYGHSFAAMYYSEATDNFDFIYTNKDPVLNSYFNVTGRPLVRMGALRLDGTLQVDTITPMVNAGVAIGGVTVTSGALTGVSSINGTSVAEQEIVTLPDNITSEITIVGTRTTGSYCVIVEPVLVNGATAFFGLSKSQAGVAGQANRISFQKGVLNEVIDITFTANNKAKLKYTKAPGDGISRGYYVKMFKI